VIINDGSTINILVRILQPQNLYACCYKQLREFFFSTLYKFSICSICCAASDYIQLHAKYFVIITCLFQGYSTGRTQISFFTKPHKKKVKVIKSGDGIHHKVDSSCSGNCTFMNAVPSLWKCDRVCCAEKVLFDINMNNLQNQIHIMVEKTEQPLLQNIRHEVQNHLHVCYATSRAHTELAQGM
jgi:hypothetical protein